VSASSLLEAALGFSALSHRHSIFASCHSKIHPLVKQYTSSSAESSSSRRRNLIHHKQDTSFNLLHQSHSTLHVEERSTSRGVTSLNGRASEQRTTPSSDTTDTDFTFDSSTPHPDAQIEQFRQEALSKYAELEALLKKSLFLEFLKELLYFHTLNLEICVPVQKRRQLYEGFLEKIGDDALISILSYRSDLFLQNRTFLFYLITFIWRDKRKDLRDAFFTKDVDHFLVNNRICHLLKKSDDDLREVLVRKLLTPKINSGDPHSFRDVDLLDFLENPDITAETQETVEDSFRTLEHNESDEIDEESNSTHVSTQVTRTQEEESTSNEDSDPFLDSALMEHTHFELQLLHRLCLFYLDRAQYETAYNIMRINCTPMDPSNPAHVRVWCHFYANLVRFVFMSAQTKKVGYRFRENRLPPTKTDIRTVSQIVCQPFTHKNISLNALLGNVYYQVVVMEFCALSKNAELATTFFVDHVLPTLKEMRNRAEPIPHEREKRLIGGLFRVLYYSDNWERLTQIYEKLFVDKKVRPCELHGKAYQYVLQSYARLGEYDKLKDHFFKMNNEAMDIDTNSVMAAVLEAYLHSGNTKALYQLFQEMYVGRYGATPTVQAICVLLRALLKDEKTVHAVKVFEQYFTTPVAKKSGNAKVLKLSILPMHSRPVAILVRAMLEQNQPEAAVKFLEPITRSRSWKRGVDTAPIIAAIVSHIGSFPEHKEDFTKILALFREMQVQELAEDEPPPDMQRA